jgi:hypothetical protein
LVQAAWDKLVADVILDINVIVNLTAVYVLKAEEAA